METPVDTSEVEPHASKRTTILISALAAGLLGGALAATFIIMRRRRPAVEPTERAEQLVGACYDLIAKIDDRLSGLHGTLVDAQHAPAAR